MSEQSNEPSPAIASLNSRLEILENFHNQSNLLIDHAQIGIEKCFERIKNLEKAIVTTNDKTKMLHEHIISYHELMLGICPIDLEKTIQRNMRGKKPYKCPVCYGNGENKLASIEEMLANNNKMYKSCGACQGKGIVWG